MSGVDINYTVMQVDRLKMSDTRRTKFGVFLEG